MSAAVSDLYDDHVVRQLTATEAKATLLALLDDVAAGEQVEITKHGHTVARLVPAGGASALEGRLRGLARTSGEDESLFSTGEAWHAS
jgi:prevent-host-death family protein